MMKAPLARVGLNELFGGALDVRIQFPPMSCLGDVNLHDTFNLHSIVFEFHAVHIWILKAFPFDKTNPII